ncbi:beta-1,3-galactosyltransferase 1-like [Triplophysa rosa]|uniref:beta-1,3-galactosyltransferase 1-like n=1 Tax=Triplophysa rosa TaxID=992332 RepID=UPI0025461379|nr:beta-1,3-galactosyltransferase 1-like [Triplophysa rosa]
MVPTDRLAAGWAYACESAFSPSGESVRYSSLPASPLGEAQAFHSSLSTSPAGSRAERLPARPGFGRVSLVRSNLLKDQKPYRRHIKKVLILLIALTFLLSAIVYISDVSGMLAMTPNTLYKKVVNKIQSYYVVIEFPRDNQVQQTTTTQTITVAVTNNITSEHYHVAHPHNYQFILDESDKCLKQNPFLVLMVPVAPQQLEARKAIRSTWGTETNVQGKSVMTLFVVGLPGGAESNKTQQMLNEESRQHGDLLQSNFTDTYVNLTIKTMVIMDWLATRCPQASYGMKVDSDMFLNLENLMTLLLDPKTPKQNYITGMVMWNIPVIRNKDSKWYIPVDLYPETNYPVYLLGMGYVFSNDLPPKIVEASKDIKPFNIEDAYVGACLKRLGIKPSSPPDPSQFRSFMSKYKREEFLRVITTILSSPKQLIEFWKDVKRSV